MALYFLEYDLRKQRNYKPLYEELARLKAVRILESLWCFKRINTNTTGLRNHFMTFVDNDDGLTVSEVTSWATFNAQGMPSQLQ